MYVVIVNFFYIPSRYIFYLTSTFMERRASIYVRLCTLAYYYLDYSIGPSLCISFQEVTDRNRREIVSRATLHYNSGVIGARSTEKFVRNEEI